MENFDDNSNEEINFIDNNKESNVLVNLYDNEDANLQNGKDSKSESSNQTPVLKTNQLKNKSSDLKDLVLDLKWSIRNRVINNLYNLSALLYASKISNKTINRSIDENHKLIAILIGLPGEDYGSLLHSNKRIKESSEDQLILKLNWNLRCQIIESLMNNHHCILYHEVVNKSNKLNLIRENNLLITTLTNLAIKNDDEIIFDDVDSDDGKEEDLYHKLGSSKTNQSLNSLNGSTNGVPTIDHDLIKKELVDFKEEIKEIMNVMNSETVFKFKFNIDSLMTNKKSAIFSEAFKCSDFQFVIRPSIKSKDNIDYLSIHLQSPPSEYLVDLILRAKILNQLGNDKNQEKLTNSKLINKNSFNIFGFNYFIQLDRLFNETNNYLDKDRNIHIEIYLKIVNVFKTNDTQI